MIQSRSHNMLVQYDEKYTLFIFITKRGNAHINVIRCIHVTTVAKQNYIFITNSACLQH